MSDERDPRLAGNRCLDCGALLDAATQAIGPGAAPSAGDWSVCMYCGALARFDAEGKLRALTLPEKLQAAEDRDLQRVRSTVLRSR